MAAQELLRDGDQKNNGDSDISDAGGARRQPASPTLPQIQCVDFPLRRSIPTGSPQINNSEAL